MPAHWAYNCRRARPVVQCPVVKTSVDQGWVAVVDDDESTRTAIHGVLRSFGIASEQFASAEALLARAGLQACALVITDVQMPGMSGLDLQARLAERGDVPVIFVSAFGNEKTRTQAMNAGALAFFGKPFDDEALIALVRRTLER